MIFEIRFECKGFEERLSFLLHQALKNEGASYAIFQKIDVLLWIECSNLPTSKLEAITQKLSDLIPQSLYLGDITSTLLENETMPPCDQTFPFQESFFYCPQCLKTQEGEQCQICQKQNTPIEYAKFEVIYTQLSNHQNIEIISQSGRHCLSLKPSQKVYCLNLEKVLEVCNLTAKELQALVSYEKPILRVRGSVEFGFEEVWLSYAHDLELFHLFDYLKDKGLNFVFGSDEAQQSIVLAPSIATPQECLVLENDSVLLLRSNEVSHHLKEIFLTHQNPDKAYLSTILQEHCLNEKNILNFYFSLKGEDRICLYNAQTQWFNEVMSFVLPNDLFHLFDLIFQQEGGDKLIANYQKAYPLLVQENISFQSLPQGIYGIWEIVRLVLGMSKNPLYLARENLSSRGVAIDYKFSTDSLIQQKFDVLSCIRSGMSFKLAGVEEGIIALGYIESFSLLPSKLYLELRHLVDIDGLSLCGDLFQFKMLGDFFYKNNRQTPVYRNINFPLLFE